MTELVSSPINPPFDLDKICSAFKMCQQWLVDLLRRRRRGWQDVQETEEFVLSSSRPTHRLIGRQVATAPAPSSSVRSLRSLYHPLPEPWAIDKLLQSLFSSSKLELFWLVFSWLKQVLKPVSCHEPRTENRIELKWWCRGLAGYANISPSVWVHPTKLAGDWREHLRSEWCRPSAGRSVPLTPVRPNFLSSTITQTRPRSLLSPVLSQFWFLRPTVSSEQDALSLPYFRVVLTIKKILTNISNSTLLTFVNRWNHLRWKCQISKFAQ